MFDTIRIWLPMERAGKIDRTLFLSNLEETVLIEREFEDIKMKGKLGGLYVTLTSTGISILGSLPKFFYRNNLKELTSVDVKQAIQKIESDLSISIKKAKLNRIDIGFNLSMDYEPRFYFNGLGELGNMHRSQINQDSLYYKNSTKTLIFYDKYKEFFKAKTVPNCFKVERNLLRYEIRFLKSVEKNFGGREILVSDMTNPEFLREIVGIWGAKYFLIRKNNIVGFQPDSINMPKDYVDFLAALGIDTRSEHIKSDIQFLKSIYAFKAKEYYSRLNSKIREISTNTKFKEESSFNRELDLKVKSTLLNWEEVFF